MAFLALAMSAVLFVITDRLFGEPGSAMVGTISGGAFGIVWYVVPLRSRYREADSD
jgi:hypothetical protein